MSKLFVVPGNGQALYEPNKINYLLPGPSQDNYKGASAEIIQQLQRDYKDVFTGISCFDGIFSLQVRPDSKPYQAPQNM